ncbi:MAG: trypsin-like peptidase domain-containing protein [Pseudomonadota bacterium]|nr:trypsin-like peptidase domain-containing protein [Pseudomonadota bacterium]
MKKISYIFLVIFTLNTTVCGALEKNPMSLNPMLNKVMPTVVNIRAQHDIPFAQHPYSEIQAGEDNVANKGSYVELGSGVILNAKSGIIVTNAHVVHDASTILITLNDNRKYLANLVGEDTVSDLAVLHIDAKNLTDINIGKSSNVKVGDFVTAIGNPFGLHQTATSGIVSGLHRRSLNGLNNFIQTDAPINPGNSGGALINLAGDLVGINTAILSTGNSGNIGIGFAIPSDLMVNIVKQLVKYSNVKRGLLGVTLQELTPQLGNALKVHTKNGVIVNSVSPESAAEKTGLKKNDVILAIDEQDVFTADEAKSYIGVLRENTKVALKIERDNLVQQKYATLKPLHAKSKVKEISPLSGITLMDYDEIDQAKNRTKGVMVTNVAQGSKAWLGGLSRGDVIISLNNKTIENLDQFTKQEASAVKENSGILIEVKRGISSYLIVVE